MSTPPGDPLRPHRHDPNPEPPSPEPDLQLVDVTGRVTHLGLADLQALPARSVSDCYIVSTGHGTSGPFSFSGVSLSDLLRHRHAWPTGPFEVEVISADGFGNRIFDHELQPAGPAGPILLSYAIDGRLMTRQEGLVRLIVPTERDDALRQVKWVQSIRVRLREAVNG